MGDVVDYKTLLEPLKLEVGPHANPGDALRAVGARERIHPRDVVAMTYTTRRAALLFTRANRSPQYDLDVIGPIPFGDGYLSVLDLRRTTARLMAEHADETVPPWSPTDPSLPDDWKPTRRAPVVA